MRVSLLVSVLVAWFGVGCEGGRCEFPPCEGVARACDSSGGCFGDERCDFVDDACGRAEPDGVCDAKPTVCSRELDPVCGCDGRMHANACVAAQAGTDVDATGVACGGGAADAGAGGVARESAPPQLP